MGTPAGGVPAVKNTASILRFFEQRANEPATMTEVARATGINPSTCFNILKTLENEGLIAFDGDTKSYCLGFGLIEIAAAIDGQRQLVDVALDVIRPLVDHTGLACLIVRVTERHEFLVVDKVESRRPIKVTVAVGQHFPATSSVLAKAYLSWVDEPVLDAVLSEFGLPQYSPNSITDPKKFKAHLEEVRERGFSTSYGEYYPDHNALAAPIFDRHGRVTHLVVTVGFAFELPKALMEEYGELLREAAEETTLKVGGVRPPRPVDRAIALPTTTAQPQ